MNGLIDPRSGSRGVAMHALTQSDLQQELYTLSSASVAEQQQRYFKTGPGEYGEGDRFIGVRVPDLRRLARSYQTLALLECTKLLRSDIHEERLLALLILVLKFQKGDAATRTEIHKLYLSHAAFVNNWDLVDISAEHVVGAYLDPGDTELLEQLARSELLWDRRIAIMATFCWIKRGEFSGALRIADLIRFDSHDLIHKAVGWMIREVGKRDQETAETFLRPRYGELPRTMLRYAIEKFPPELRRAYLAGTITTDIE